MNTPRLLRTGFLRSLALSLTLPLALLLPLGLVGCSSDSPSNGPTAPDPGVGNTAGAQIDGRVTSGSAAGMTVTVRGTALQTVTDAQGAFAFLEVPPGDRVLVFATSSGEAALGIPGVRSNERIELEVSVQGATATVESIERQVTDDGQRVFPRYGRPPVSLVPLVLDHNLRNTRQIADTFMPLTPMPMQLLVGDGPELAVAYRTARELGITPMVHAIGAQEEVVPLLSVSDVFLLPSAQESFGLAALEAMACEVPVVASRVGGLPEVIEDRVSGFLHDPGAVDEMAASAIALLTDSALHERMSREACRRVREEFCVERVVPMYEAFYERTVSV